MQYEIKGLSSSTNTKAFFYIGPRSSKETAYIWCRKLNIIAQSEMCLLNLLQTLCTLLVELDHSHVAAHWSKPFRKHFQLHYFLLFRWKDKNNIRNTSSRARLTNEKKASSFTLTFFPFKSQLLDFEKIKGPCKLQQQTLVYKKLKATVLLYKLWSRLTKTERMRAHLFLFQLNHLLASFFFMTWLLFQRSWLKPCMFLCTRFF